MAPTRSTVFAADRVRDAYACLLVIGHRPSGISAGPRRQRALSILGTSGLTADTWRRAGQHEFHFMKILARELLRDWPVAAAA
ncbi:hypothetical protein [Frankia umida]|uniref:hypothetical protein n=1 Tax=Frankia umida TaxID=573489 RepID=UPI002010942C|nr:hypothetical protein [Frankia umida]